MFRPSFAGLGRCLSLLFLFLLVSPAWAGANDAAAKRALTEAMDEYAKAKDADKADGALLEAIALCGNDCSPALLAKAWMYIGLVRGNGQGWVSPEIVGSLVVGAVLVAAFVAWELRAKAPMLPMRFFRSRAFALANASSFLMFFGMFGSIFLLAQFFQTVQGYSPFGAGLRILPWTLAPMFIAPVAGALSDRISPRLIIATGLTLQAVALAWIGLVTSPAVPYSELVAPLVVAGVGMALFFAPVANVVLSAVRPVEEGQASGANNSIRELGGVFGVAVLASVFSHVGGYESARAFSDGMNAAVLVGAAVVAVGAVAAFLIPSRLRTQEATTTVALSEAA